jgi:hypothetical protein
MGIDFDKIEKLFWEKYKGNKSAFTKDCIDVNYYTILHMVNPKEKRRHGTQAVTLYRVAKALDVSMEELMLE